MCGIMGENEQNGTWAALEAPPGVAHRIGGSACIPILTYSCPHLFICPVSTVGSASFVNVVLFSQAVGSIAVVLVAVRLKCARFPTASGQKSRKLTVAGCGLLPQIPKATASFALTRKPMPMSLHTAFRTACTMVLYLLT